MNQNQNGQNMAKISSLQTNSEVRSHNFHADSESNSQYHSANKPNQVVNNSEHTSATTTVTVTGSALSSKRPQYFATTHSNYESHTGGRTFPHPENHPHTGGSQQDNHMSFSTSNSTSSTPVPQTTTSCVPPGVLAIYHACSAIYGNQPNPLQVTAVKKYW